MNALILALLLCFNARGEDVFVARFSENYTHSSHDLLLEIGERKLITGIKTRNNKKKRTKRYGLEKLSKSVPLAKTAGVVLASLTCSNFNTSRGCDIEINYPSNLPLGQFTTFKTKLRKKKNTWGLFNNGRRIQEMHLIARKALGLPIGIKRIELHHSLIKRKK